MEARNCWPMQIYFSIFVSIVEKENQVFYKILYLKRNNCLFKTFYSGWLIIRECAFLSGICDNVRSVFWNSFARKGFPETNQVASVNQGFTTNGWTMLFGLYRISFPCGSSIGSLTERFKSSGYHGWALQTSVIRVRRRTHFCSVFRRTLKIILKGRKAYGRPLFQFCIIASIPSLYEYRCQAIYWGSWWHKQANKEANRSIVRESGSWETAWKTLG